MLHIRLSKEVFVIPLDDIKLNELIVKSKDSKRITDLVKHTKTNRIERIQ